MDKQFILDEIKRTAEANGGVALGRQKFEAETGIKPYDYQRYWSRFSEAQCEAGFVPNELQRAYPLETLIEKFIEVMREIKRYPTFGELRVRGTHDPEFPNSKTFHRLGKQNEIAAKVLEYCKAKPEFADVISLCERVIQSKKAGESRDNSSDGSNFEYVYLIKSGRYYKIGKTNALGRREREFAIQLPDKPSIVHSIKTDDAAGIESYWHQRFETKRKGGEWFDLNASDIRAFKRWKRIA
jgi:hypothetical protein